MHSHYWRAMGRRILMWTLVVGAVVALAVLRVIL